MLISHKHKFITIDIPKTGTRSLRTALKPLNIIDIVGEPKSPRDCDFSHHGTISEAVTEFNKRGWDYNDYFKYSVVRNPWDRYFSFLIYYKTKLDFYKYNKPLNNAQERQKKHAINRFHNKTYEEILRNLIIRFPAQKKYLVDENNNIVVDEIGQLENIQDSFNKFCESVGISNKQLPHENKSDYNISRDSLYTQELIDIVAEKEKWVIDKFNYNYI